MSRSYGRRVRMTPPQYVKTVLVRVIPPKEEEPTEIVEVPISQTTAEHKKSKHKCRWCGRRYTINENRVCDACFPEWNRWRVWAEQGDYPMSNTKQGRGSV